LFVMLFAFLALTSATSPPPPPPVLYLWPCSRLNQAWRSVWVTCSISAWVPTSPSTAAVGSLAGGFYSGPAIPNAPIYGNNDGTQVDVNGQFTPGGNGPSLCTTSPNTGGNFARNRCRRSLDTYGNLLRLCQTPSKLPGVTSTGTQPDYQPLAYQQPHANNVASLGFFSNWCLTGTAPATPSTACPGLNGWFTVVFNACNFKTAPGLTTPVPANAISPNIPNYFTNWATNTVTFTTPAYFCGSSPVGPAEWNPSGPSFHSTKCRKALDIFGRSAARCNPNTGLGLADWTRNLSPAFLSFVPGCN